MEFKLIPMIDVMIDLYAKPRSVARFEEYLQMLQGISGKDMILPIAGFNPMAKEHILQKLIELKALDAEQVVEHVLDDVNLKMASDPSSLIFSVVLNLADDLRGAWTNRYTTDYDSKFKIDALVTRRFCTPYFWSSENYTIALIRERTLQYILRTNYRSSNPAPVTLQQHVAQEVFVAINKKGAAKPFSLLDFELLNEFYQEYKESDNYNLIFNFFYGDQASISLSYPTFGISTDLSGFLRRYWLPRRSL